MTHPYGYVVRTPNGHGRVCGTESAAHRAAEESAMEVDGDVTIDCPDGRSYTINGPLAHDFAEEMLARLK